MRYHSKGTAGCIGRVTLDPGPHEIELRFEEGGLGPGSGGAPFGFGPIVISPTTAAAASVSYHEPRRRRRPLRAQVG